MHEYDVDTLSQTIIPLCISSTVKREVDLAYYCSICSSLEFYGVAELSLKLLGVDLGEGDKVLRLFRKLLSMTLIVQSPTALS